MNILELKGRRVSKGLKQIDVANELGITGKTFCIYENTTICKFSLDQVKTLAKLYDLTVSDVNEIFFDNELPNGND